MFGTQTLAFCLIIEILKADLIQLLTQHGRITKHLKVFPEHKLFEINTYTTDEQQDYLQLMQ